MLPKRWLIADPMPQDLLRQYRQISPILAQILYNRGFTGPAAARDFLNTRDFAHYKIDPFVFKGMRQAVGRISFAIQRGEPIAVYGDFDADGVTSTALMMQALRALGANARPYIPHRVDEGYGLNTPALLGLAAEGVRLVITVDCGIRSVQEVADAAAAGLDIIITDHHSVGPELPEALAVINPQQEDCPGDPRLAGVGVAFMLAYALLKARMRNGGKRRYPALLLSDLLDLVAIGTVADIMPLNAPLNRVLVHHGLQTLNSARRPGIRALMDVAGVQPGKVNAMSIGFALGPRINAAGRLESAMLAYELLVAADPVEAARHAAALQDLNRRRQDLTQQAQETVQRQLEESGEYDAPLIFTGDPGFEAGIVGLVAGRLVEQYYRPVVVLEMGEDESRASCRSIPEFNITQALDECADLLVRHGGHAMAAGFTVHNHNIPALREHLLQRAAEALEGQELLPRLEIDMEVDLHQLSEELVQELARLEPTGHQNRAPVFVSRGLHVLECRTVGSDGSHLKLRLAGSATEPFEAIAFRLGGLAEDMPPQVDVAYNLEVNEWNGRRSLQLRVLDLQAGA